MGKMWDWLKKLFGTDAVDWEQIPKHHLPRPHRGHDERDKLPPEPYKRDRGWLRNLFFPGERSDDVRRRFDNDD